YRYPVEAPDAGTTPPRVTPSCSWADGRLNGLLLPVLGATHSVTVCTRSRVGGDRRTARNPARPMAKASQRRRLTSTQGVPRPEGGEPRRTKAAAGRLGRRPDSCTNSRRESGHLFVQGTSPGLLANAIVLPLFKGELS